MSIFKRLDQLEEKVKERAELNAGRVDATDEFYDALDRAYGITTPPEERKQYPVYSTPEYERVLDLVYGPGGVAQRTATHEQP
jgi:hypothetical protein